MLSDLPNDLTAFGGGINEKKDTRFADIILDSAILYNQSIWNSERRRLLSYVYILLRGSIQYILYFNNEWIWNDKYSQKRKKDNNLAHWGIYIRGCHFSIWRWEVCAKGRPMRSKKCNTMLPDL